MDGQKFDFDVYLSYRDSYFFFSRTNFSDIEPIWSEKDLAYDYSDSNSRVMNLTLPVSEKIRQNKTLYLHMQITTKNPFYDPSVNY